MGIVPTLMPNYLPSPTRKEPLTMTMEATQRIPVAIPRATVTARYPGTCPCCGGQIDPGAQVVRVGGSPWFHADCLPSVQAKIRTGEWAHCGAFTSKGRPCLVYVPAGEHCHVHRFA